MIRIAVLFSTLIGAMLAQQDMGVITGVLTNYTGAAIPGARSTPTKR